MRVPLTFEDRNVELGLMFNPSDYLADGTIHMDEIMTAGIPNYSAIGPRKASILEVVGRPPNNYALAFHPSREDRPPMWLATRLDLEQLISLIVELAPGWLISTTVHYEFEIDMAKIAAALGLPHASESVVSLLEHKADLAWFAMKRRLPGPRFRRCTSAKQIRKAIRDLGGDVVLKPNTGSCGEGVIRPASPSDELAIWRHLKYRNEAGIESSLVEEFVDGDEYGVQAFVRHGYVMWLMTTRKIVGNCFRVVGHVYDPADQERAAVEKLIGNELDVLCPAMHRMRPSEPGMSLTLLNGDYKSPSGDNRRVMRLDLQARTGGTQLLALANAAFGLPCDTHAFEKALWGNMVGKALRMENRTPRAAIVRRLYEDIEGVAVVSDEVALWRESFWFGYDTVNSQIPMSETHKTIGPIGHPLIAVDDVDIDAAWRRWYRAASYIGMKQPDGGVITYDCDGGYRQPMSEGEFLRR